MTRITIAAALLAIGLSGAAHGGEHQARTAADRAFRSEYDCRAGAPVQGPHQQYYRGGFGSFGGAAGTASTLGY